MLIKSKDQPDIDQVNYLKELLERDLPARTKQEVDRELKTLAAGEKGEKDSAYYLDFYIKPSKNWAVIHDLRIEHDGLSAQIDHLVIGRFLDIYVLETKSFASGVAIGDEGEFCYFHNNRPVSIPSPIEQNERHIHLLKRFLKEENLLPKRMGITLTPTFKNIVLVSPTSRLKKPQKGLYDTSMVIKADQFIERVNKETNELKAVDFINVAKVISPQTLEGFATRLAAMHKPSPIDYRKRFAIKSKAEPSKASPVAEVGVSPKVKEEPKADESAATTKKTGGGYFCAKCRAKISKKAAIFCFTNKKRFGGKAYCFDCQKSF